VFGYSNFSPSGGVVKFVTQRVVLLVPSGVVTLMRVFCGRGWFIRVTLGWSVVPVLLLFGVWGTYWYYPR